MLKAGALLCRVDGGNITSTLNFCISQKPMKRNITMSLKAQTNKIA